MADRVPTLPALATVVDVDFCLEGMLESLSPRGLHTLSESVVQRVDSMSRFERVLQLLIETPLILLSPIIAGLIWYALVPPLPDDAAFALHSAVLGGLAVILAIIFSFSLLAIQHGAERYTALVLKYYQYDPRIIAVLLVFSLGIVLEAFALGLRWSGLGAAFAVSILFLAALLLVLQFMSMTRLIDPHYVIGRLVQDGMRTSNEERVGEVAWSLNQIGMRSVERTELTVVTPAINALKKVGEGICSAESKAPQVYTILTAIECLGDAAARKAFEFPTRATIFALGDIAKKCVTKGPPFSGSVESAVKRIVRLNGLALDNGLTETPTHALHALYGILNEMLERKQPNAEGVLRWMGLITVDSIVHQCHVVHNFTQVTCDWVGDKMNRPELRTELNTALILLAAAAIRHYKDSPSVVDELCYTIKNNIQSLVIEKDRVLVTDRGYHDSVYRRRFDLARRRKPDYSSEIDTFETYCTGRA